MKFYAVLLDCSTDLKYFQTCENAIKYLEENQLDGQEFTIDPPGENECGEVWNEFGESIGCYYKIETED